ncbi:hypothetical protein [Hymenobacter sp. 5414T-23]|uniref:hypothetical protein n=1 Tax=Hymenobacter sp. 5414T-23 TaxID=2932252 RepID=UPI001FD60E99|nr:hypothetical protein [Hymenobacter sp. 5414T-23]UOQ81778.1 hypothetical protein MUN83_03025 [Hymenobacter sp. 5414T-23]
MFWLDERGCAHSNALHYFGQEDLEMSRHLKGMQIAQCLNTYISGEEGSFFYIPGWHSYFWNDTDELEAVSIDELLEYRRQYDDDAGNMAERLKAIRAAMEVQAPPKLSTVSPSAPSRQSYQWLFWLMLLIAAYYLEQLLLF